MKTKPPKRRTIGIVSSALALSILIVFLLFRADRANAGIEAQLEELDQAWQTKLLLTQPQEEDPRKDDDTLYTASEFRGEVISVKDYKVEPGSFLTGAGWRLDGGAIDLIEKENVVYILYGRQVGRYDAGLWNNSLDSERSFDDFFVVKYENGQAAIVDHQRLGPHYSQIFIGLRLSSSGTAEMLQHRTRNTASDAEVIGSYR